MPKSSNRSIKFLQSTSQTVKRRASKNQDKTRPPTGCDIEFLFFRLIEIFPVEDFNEFQDGLKKLFPTITERKGTKDLFSTFNRETASIDQALWQDIGTIRREVDWRATVFGNFGQIRDLPFGIDHISVEMIHYLPSLVVVTFDVILNESLSEEIKKIQAAYHLGEINLRSLLPWKVWKGYSTVESLRVQKREILRWFESLRIDTENCLEPFFKGHFLRQKRRSKSRLPAFEVFAFKGFDASDIEKWEREDWGWFESYSFPIFGDRYGNEFFQYFPVDRLSRDTIDPSPRVGIFWEKFVDSFKSDKNDPENTPDLIRMRGIEESRETFRSVTLKVAIQSFLQSIQKQIENLRRFTLKDSGRINKFVKQMDVYEKVLRASALRDRFDLEFKLQGDVVKAEMHYLSKLVYLRTTIDPKQNLFGLTVNQIESTTSLLKDHLLQIRGSFSELVNLRDLRTNFKLQRRLWWLAIVATIATILGAIAGWPTIKEFIQDVSNIHFEKTTTSESPPKQ